MTLERDGLGLALLCRTGSCISAFPIRWVIETLRPTPVEPLAGVSSFVIGVAIIRGIPTPVLDAGELVVGLRQARPTRFVTLRGNRPSAVAVDEVLGVRNLAAESLVGLPPLLRGVNAQVVAKLGSLDSELLFVLSEARLVSEEVWQAIAAVNRG